MGKMQIHKFVEYLRTLEPEMASVEEDLYADEWNIKDYEELSEE